MKPWTEDENPFTFAYISKSVNQTATFTAHANQINEFPIRRI